MDKKGITGNNGYLSASAIKIIAIIAMTVDHIGWLFVDTRSPAGVCLHFAGRLTAPLMCFFITEGYHHTRDLKRYCGRLAVFALISQIPFMYFEKTAFGAMDKGSVIWTLLFSLISVWVINTGRIEKAFKLPAILFMIFCARQCDCGTNAVYFTLAFELARDKGRIKQLQAYSAVCFIALLPVVKELVLSFSDKWYELYRFGIFLPVLVLLLYNGERGGSTSLAIKNVSKYFFYVFYPLHIVILTFLRTKLGK